MTDKQRQETYAQMLVRLSRSNFRSRFHLKAQDKQYIREKGWNTVLYNLSVILFGLLLPRLSGKMAWHPAGRAAFSGAAGLYRWNADKLDEERNGKLRIRVRVKRDLRFTALHRIKKRRSCVSSAILAYSCG